jgi:hypothetical protein
MTSLLASVFAFASGAFASEPVSDADVSGTYILQRDGDRRKASGALHLGMELRGVDPGVAARFDLGQRVSVEGSVFAGIPRAESLKWTGGASLGLELAPMRLQLGSKGSLDFRVGAGGVFTSKSHVHLEAGGFEWSEWVAGTLQLSPNGSWSIYAGLLATDVVPATGDAPTLQPRTGVRFKLD